MNKTLLFIYLLYGLLFISCENHDNDFEKGNLVRFFTNASNHDGSIRISSGTILIGDDAAMEIPGGGGQLLYNGNIYKIWFTISGWENSAKGGKWTNSFSISDTDQKVTIVIEKVHSKNEITVSFSGFLNYSNIKMHYDDSPWSVPHGKFTPYHGYNDNITTTNLIKGVTADGATQLQLWLGEYNSIASYTVTCDYPMDWGNFSDPQKDPVTNQYYMIYTAPEWEDMPYPDGFEIEPSLKLEILENNGSHFNQTIVVPKLHILPPAIALIHGIAGEIESCFGEFYEWLLLDGYKDYQIQKIDYKPSNKTSFDINTFTNKIIETELNNLYQKLLNQGYVSSRYILCGHSMGGILSRYYAQYVRPQAVYKIITLDTPHWGSELADVGSTVVQSLIITFSGSPVRVRDYINKVYMADNGWLTGYRDLSTTSPAITKMNNEGLKHLYGIGCHAVCSYFDDAEARSLSMDNAVLTLRKKARRTNDLIINTVRMAKTKLADQNKQIQREMLDALYKETCHDGVVALHSQRGGLASQYCTMQTAPFEGTLGQKSMAHHINTNNWEVTYENLERLFLLPLTDKVFTLTGFNSPENSAYSYCANGSRADSDETIDWKLGSSASEHISIDKVSINGLSMVLTVSSSSAIVNNMLIVQADDNQIDSNSNSNEYTIDFDEDTKKIELLIMGRTNDYQLYYDYRIINL